MKVATLFVYGVSDLCRGFLRAWSHLHPLAQAQLAELLASVSAARGVQFIVETRAHFAGRAERNAERQPYRRG